MWISSAPELMENILKLLQQGRLRAHTLCEAIDSLLEDVEAVQFPVQMAGRNLNVIGSFHSVALAECTLICCSGC